MSAPQPEGISPADLVVLDALWTGVVNDWADDARHHKLLDHARATGALLEVARRYGLLRDDPERGETAKKRLAAIALIATNELYATKTTPAKKTPGWVVGLAVSVCVTLLGWACLSFAGVLGP